MENSANEHTHLYSKTYSDALRTNEAETARWTSYQREHVELKENLRMYQKVPRADIMIPMGSKAFLPGQLYHTGEVMVSHGCGYFSDCSTEQAQAIADRRIRLANELLLKYDRERALYSDKLDVPLTSEAFGTGTGGQEIIEAYDEETEKRWREEHRCRVRESKQREAKARAAERNAAKEVSDSELFAKLEEMELLEELEKEMDQLGLAPGVDDDDQLGRLMRGEITINERKRTAYQQTERSVERETVTNFQSDPISTENLTSASNPNPVAEEEIETTDEDGEGEGDEEDDITTEFSELLNETKHYTKKEKIKVFQAKLKDVRQRLYQNSIDLVQKVDLYQLHDELEEALDFLLPSNESESAERHLKPEPSTQPTDPENGKKVVQFAEQDQIKLITNRHQEPPHDEQESFARTNNTLFLPIVHSERYNDKVAEDYDEIESPGDFYRQFLAQEESKKKSPTIELKSILKNNKTNSSQHHPVPPVNVTKEPPVRKDEVMLPQPDVLGEVIEHKMPESGGSISFPDVQPQQQKKKVSRFKQQRH
uniref:Unconventional prefoldin RPB5 interactor n=1 Tax=Anopheles dirus TaxID=7168 RepID=A0A182NHK6_9DIPT